MSENMTDMDWATPEYLARLTAEELRSALDASGIEFIGCGHSDDDDGREISISFDGIDAAGRAVALGVPFEETLGGFYDRAVASCLTLTEMGARKEPVSDAEVGAAIDRGWMWTVHPDRRGWHVSVDMSLADAPQLTANLNASRLAGA